MGKFYERVCRAEVVVASLCFAVSCILIFSTAIARTIGSPINWAKDLSLFLFAWSVFLSADAALRDDRLVSVEILVTRLPANARRGISIFCYLVILIFLIAMAWFGANLAWFARRRVFQGIAGFSYSWVLLSIPVCFLLQSFTVIGKLRRLLSRRTQASPESEV